MIKYTFCPTITWYRFVVIISLVELAIFLLCLIVTIAGKTYELNPTAFLGPDWTSWPMEDFDKNAVKMKEG